MCCLAVGNERSHPGIDSHRQHGNCDLSDGKQQRGPAPVCRELSSQTTAQRNAGQKDCEHGGKSIDAAAEHVSQHPCPQNLVDECISTGDQHQGQYPAGLHSEDLAQALGCRPTCRDEWRNASAEETDQGSSGLAACGRRLECGSCRYERRHPLGQQRSKNENDRIDHDTYPDRAG